MDTWNGDHGKPFKLPELTDDKIRTRTAARKMLDEYANALAEVRRHGVRPLDFLFAMKETSALKKRMEELLPNEAAGAWQASKVEHHLRVMRFVLTEALESAENHFGPSWWTTATPNAPLAVPRMVITFVLLFAITPPPLPTSLSLTLRAP